MAFWRKSEKEVELLLKEERLRIEEKRIELREENLQREMANIKREAEWQYQFDKKALEDEWHCKLGNAIDEKWGALHQQYIDLMKLVIEKLPELKPDIVALEKKSK